MNCDHCVKDVEDQCTPEDRTACENLDALETFERELRRTCEATAPNGATYELVTFNHEFAVRRTVPAASPHARAEMIRGFNGAEFISGDRAYLWALADGRLEIGAEGAMTSNRKQLV